MSLTFDAKRLQMLFVAMYRASENERNAAAGAFYRYLVDCQLHPDEIALAIGREDDLITKNQRVIARLEVEVSRLHHENMFLRRHVDAGMLADAIKSREVDYQWYALEDLVRERLGDEHNALPRHWRGIVAKHAQVTSYQMQRWENGVAPIPEAVFEAVRALPRVTTVKQDRRPKRYKTNRPPSDSKADKYVWPDEVLRPIVDQWLHGASKQAILAATEAVVGTGVITEGMLTNKIEHSPPPAFLEARVRPAGEPLDWPELWLLGATLFRGTDGDKRQRGWRTAALSKLGLHRTLYPPVDLNAGTTQGQIDELRTQYVQRNLRQPKVRAVPALYDKLLDLMISVGRDGATRSDVLRQIGPKHLRRISEMQKRLLVFDSGLRRQDEVIYVHCNFADQHAAAWQTARRRYSNDPTITRKAG